MKDLLANLQYCVNYEAHTVHNPNCSCGAICRCSTIGETKITDTDRVLTSIMDNLPKNTSVWLKYAIDRLFSIYRLYDKGLYSVSVGNGYYGQEVDGILLEKKVHDEFMADVKKFEGIRDHDLLVVDLLEKEYGYLLDCLKGAKYSIKKVPLQEIQFGQVEHYRRVDRVAMKYYQDHPMNIPQGVALQAGRKYRLIDGYHRCAACLQKNQDTVSLIVAKH